MASRSAVVHGQRPDRDAGRRRRRRERRREPVLVARRDPHRRPLRHVLHGVPQRPGAAARPAADDPVAAAVRLHRRAPGLAVRLRAVRGLQRLQHDPGRPVGEQHDPHAREAGDRRRDGARGRDRADRLRLHPPHRAGADLRVPARLRRVHDRRDRHAAPARRRARPGQLRPHAVPHAVRRHGRLPDQLGDLRLGLLALPAAGRHRAQDVRVDVLGLGARRDLADGPRRAALDGGRQGLRRRSARSSRRQRDLRRLRHDRAAVRRARPDHRHRAEPLRRLAHADRRGRLVPARPADARQSA